MTTPAQSDKDRVVIFDTTLRDGEQCPGATMTLEEKLEVAELLDEMGVDIIEAGFPIASNGDFEAVSEIARAREERRPSPASPAPSPATSRAPAKRCAMPPAPRIHTFVSTSPIHLAHQMRKSEEQVLDIIAATVTQARNLVDDVEWSAMDATRTPHRLSVPLRRDGDRRRRDHDQSARHGGLRHAGRIPHDVPVDARARAECRQGGVFGSLPQRSRPGGRQYAGRCRGRRAADRMHDQRHRRAGRQCRARRGRDGAEGASRRAAVSYQRRLDDADAGVKARVRGDVVPGAVQQGDRRAQRLCA